VWQSFVDKRRWVLLHLRVGTMNCHLLVRKITYLHSKKRNTAWYMNGWISIACCSKNFSCKLTLNESERSSRNSSRHFSFLIYDLTTLEWMFALMQTVFLCTIESESLAARYVWPQLVNDSKNTIWIEGNFQAVFLLT
jgi:hypothetical protein